MENFYKGALILGTVVLMFASTGIKFERTIDSGIGFGHTGNEKMEMTKIAMNADNPFGLTGVEKVARRNASKASKFPVGRTGSQKMIVKQLAKPFVLPLGRTGAEKAALKN